MLYGASWALEKRDSGIPTGPEVYETLLYTMLCGIVLLWRPGTSRTTVFNSVSRNFTTAVTGGFTGHRK